MDILRSAPKCWRINLCYAVLFSLKKRQAPKLMEVGQGIYKAHKGFVSLDMDEI